MVTFIRDATIGISVTFIRDATRRTPAGAARSGCPAYQIDFPSTLQPPTRTAARALFIPPTLIVHARLQNEGAA